nr:MAG TPA: hypothetical protein [Caudoviricetes sp.]
MVITRCKIEMAGFTRHSTPGAETLGAVYKG